MYWQKIKKFLATRWGFFTLLTFLFWAKTLAVYYLDFNLGVSGIYQHLVLWVNPLGTTLLLLSIGLYIRRTFPAYLAMILIYLANSALLLFNVIYYREFTDFMTINVIFGYSSVSNGLSTSSSALLTPKDIIFVVDLLLILGLILTKAIKFDKRPIPKLSALAMTSFALFFITFNLTLGEISRPQLLGRTFDRAYLVKYLGLDFFTVYDGLKTAKTNQARNEANSADLNKVINFAQEHYAKPNEQIFGVAKGKNVIVIHLESFQQFLINYKLNDQEVTPFLNSLYNSKQTYSFANFFNQVGQGKTSDAENMLETSTYGLPQGSLFSTLGSENTFQAAPAILNQEAGYTSAVFHGNVGSFWNRNDVYKNMGYQYFFDASYYDTSAERLSEYGLKDKYLFHDSVKYLEQLQQPFYTKFITVTNHFPYTLDSADADFPAANTGEASVDNYFVTAHYLDQAIETFFNYLKKSGLYDNSVIILYGDHYGISDSRNLKLASLLGKSASTWSDFDNTQMQRVPFMIHIPGQENGGVQTQYGGEIDVLPTLLHLLGINSSAYLQFGTDLFSKEHDQTVAFRNGSFITPKYTVVSGTIYDNQTGAVVTHPSKVVSDYLAEQKQKVRTELSLSDTLNTKNLLRFYVPAHFTPVDPSLYDYKKQFERLKALNSKLGAKSKSLYSKNKHKSTVDDYPNEEDSLNQDNTNNQANSTDNSQIETSQEESTASDSSASTSSTAAPALYATSGNTSTPPTE